MDFPAAFPHCRADFSALSGPDMVASQAHALDWRDGDVPVSRRFEDPFYSFEDGWAESAHVFLSGNGLPDRFRAGFRIAELGFGTGLNLALTLAHWAGPGRIAFTSFEAFPLAPADAARALARFPEAAPFAPLVSELLATGRVQTETADIRLVEGDARETLPAWGGAADAWFLDGFAPARNPELWDDALMAEVGRHTAPGGTFATYTAAGHVRRALSAAGFAVERVPGYGRKRHMTKGVK
ncbi:tRNA (5-methylaminomethyl-2-thiouridine)(34)-methyltransferase MnmD [Rhodobacterales bacterium HKCCE2091]|nr:tRNA (5-methylaminomethyl-2-thiouridine)(34)-methyltransferase MnmD [Rhodobacterales bacterium HKCCE2091]